MSDIVERLRDFAAGLNDDYSLADEAADVIESLEFRLAAKRASNRFSRPEKHAAALRELRQRRRVYPRLVGRGRMTQADADRQIAIMEEIANDYKDQGDLFDELGIGEGSA